MHRQPRGLEAIVEEQVRRWETRKKSRAMRSMSNNIWPVITLSRQYGTQGAALARQLAEQIGFECWDKEIVEKIAEHSTAPARLFESLDEHRRSAISEMISSVMGDGNPSSAEYLREVNRIVRTLAD